MANITIKNHISISPKTLFENPYVSLLGLLFILVTTTSIQTIKIREKQLDHERIRTSLADTIKMEEKSTQKNNKKLAKSLLILFEIPIVIDKC